MSDDAPQDHAPRPVDAAFRASGNRDVWAEPSYSGVTSAFRRRYTRDLAGVDLVFWGIPLDTAVSNRSGARFGPQAIRRISAMFEPADPAWPQGWNPFTRLACIDYGDAVWDYGKPWTAPAEIARQAAPILDAGATLVAMGGDHSMTYPLLKAHAARFGPLALVQFDAHQDTWHDDDERVDHGSFVARAVREGLIDPARSVQIGIRTVAPETCGLHIIDADRVWSQGVARTLADILGIVGGAPAYLTFDIDALDPAHAPGTGTPVPGGLTSREALALVRGLSGIDIKGCDVVEVAPAYDHADVTANAAAAILQQMACLVAQRRGAPLAPATPNGEGHGP
jgi:agmatinase